MEEIELKKKSEDIVKNYTLQLARLRAEGVKILNNFQKALSQKALEKTRSKIESL